mmetsp:Transcript_21572/g.26807  ORF Transcript_21572/g.26807 Transcript_21572/m.26807 type:complete len:313 (-) Transcript_21572:81-1019(-)
MASTERVSLAVRLVFSGSLEELKQVLEEAPDVCTAADSTFNDSTPLHVAVGENEEACAFAILQACPEAVQCRDIEDRTPLMHVCADTSIELIRALLNAGAAVDAIDKGGRSVLHYAVEMHNVDAVEELLVAGANPNLAAISSETPVSLAMGLSEDENDDDDEEDSALPTRNVLICRSLGSRVGEPNLLGDCNWSAIPNLEEHDFQATVFQAPFSNENGAQLKLTIAVAVENDDDELQISEEENETTIHEAIVDAELLEVCPESAAEARSKFRVFLKQTPVELFNLRPELLLVRGRELVVAVSSRTVIPEGQF